MRSEAFGDGEAIPVACAGKRAAGRNLSPPLAWTAPPPGTAEQLLVIEDVDVPMGSPFVHCVALIAAQVRALPAGGLAAAAPATGVRVQRSGLGRGYPEPIKGHGPHRYVFQVFALGAPAVAGAWAWLVGVGVARAPKGSPDHPSASSGGTNPAGRLPKPARLPRLRRPLQSQAWGLPCLGRRGLVP